MFRYGLIADDKNLFTLWPDVSAYFQDIDHHYTHIKSINKDFWDFAIYYTHTPRRQQLLALKSKIQKTLDDFVKKAKYKKKRLQKNLSCLIPRLRRRFSSDPDKMMAGGFYGRKMTKEEIEAKKQARIETAQSRNDQDPLLALLHEKDFDYDEEDEDMEYNSMGKSLPSNSYSKCCL